MKKKNIIIGCVVIVLIVIGILINKDKPVESTSVNNNLPQQTSNHQIAIDIKGEVKSPGLYYLNSNSRVIDAINIAGGITPFADIENINLANKLEDGMIVNIFKKEDASQVNKISINRASINELTRLEGIGEAKAKSIIEYRNKNGYFMSIEELRKVNGITEDIYNKNKKFLCL